MIGADKFGNYRTEADWPIEKRPELHEFFRITNERYKSFHAEVYSGDLMACVYFVGSQTAFLIVGEPSSVELAVEDYIHGCNLMGL